MTELQGRGARPHRRAAAAAIQAIAKQQPNICAPSNSHSTGSGDEGESSGCDSTQRYCKHVKVCGASATAGLTSDAAAACLAVFAPSECAARPGALPLPSTCQCSNKRKATAMQHTAATPAAPLGCAHSAPCNTEVAAQTQLSMLGVQQQRMHANQTAEANQYSACRVEAQQSEQPLAPDKQQWQPQQHTERTMHLCTNALLQPAHLLLADSPLDAQHIHMGTAQLSATAMIHQQQRQQQTAVGGGFLSPGTTLCINSDHQLASHRHRSAAEPVSRTTTHQQSSPHASTRILQRFFELQQQKHQMWRKAQQLQQQLQQHWHDWEQLMQAEQALLPLLGLPSAQHAPHAVQQQQQQLPLLMPLSAHQAHQQQQQCGLAAGSLAALTPPSAGVGCMQHNPAVAAAAAAAGAATQPAVVDQQREVPVEAAAAEMAAAAAAVPQAHTAASSPANVIQLQLLQQQHKGPLGVAMHVAAQGAAAACTHSNHGADVHAKVAEIICKLQELPEWPQLLAAVEQGWLSTTGFDQFVDLVAPLLTQLQQHAALGAAQAAEGQRQQQQQVAAPLLAQSQQQQHQQAVLGPTAAHTKQRQHQQQARGSPMPQLMTALAEQNDCDSVPPAATAAGQAATLMQQLTVGEQQAAGHVHIANQSAAADLPKCEVANAAAAAMTAATEPGTVVSPAPGTMPSQAAGGDDAGSTTQPISNIPPASTAAAAPSEACTAGSEPTSPDDCPAAAVAASDLSAYPVLYRDPAVGDVVAYQLLEGSQVTELRLGQVAAYCPAYKEMLLQPWPDPNVHPLQHRINATVAAAVAERKPSQRKAAVAAEAKEDVLINSVYEASGECTVTVGECVRLLLVQAAVTTVTNAEGGSHDKQLQQQQQEGLLPDQQLQQQSGDSADVVDLVSEDCTSMWNSMCPERAPQAELQRHGWQQLQQQQVEDSAAEVRPNQGTCGVDAHATLGSEPCDAGATAVAGAHHACQLQKRQPVLQADAVCNGHCIGAASLDSSPHPADSNKHTDTDHCVHNNMRCVDSATAAAAAAAAWSAVVTDACQAATARQVAPRKLSAAAAVRSAVYVGPAPHQGWSAAAACRSAHSRHTVSCKADAAAADAPEAGVLHCTSTGADHSMKAAAVVAPSFPAAAAAAAVGCVLTANPSQHDQTPEAGAKQAECQQQEPSGSALTPTGVQQACTQQHVPSWQQQQQQQQLPHCDTHSAEQEPLTVQQLQQLMQAAKLPMARECIKVFSMWADLCCTEAVGQLLLLHLPALLQHLQRHYSASTATNWLRGVTAALKVPGVQEEMKPQQLGTVQQEVKDAIRALVVAADAEPADAKCAGQKAAGSAVARKLRTAKRAKSAPTAPAAQEVCVSRQQQATTAEGISQHVGSSTDSPTLTVAQLYGLLQRGRPKSTARAYLSPFNLWSKACGTDDVTCLLSQFSKLHSCLVGVDSKGRRSYAVTTALDYLKAVWLVLKLPKVAAAAGSEQQLQQLRQHIAAAKNELSRAATAAAKVARPAPKKAIPAQQLLEMSLESLPADNALQDASKSPGSGPARPVHTVTPPPAAAAAVLQAELQPGDDAAASYAFPAKRKRLQTSPAVQAPTGKSLRSAVSSVDAATTDRRTLCSDAGAAAAAAAAIGGSNCLAGATATGAALRTSIAVVTVPPAAAVHGSTATGRHAMMAAAVQMAAAPASAAAAGTGVAPTAAGAAGGLGGTCSAEHAPAADPPPCRPDSHCSTVYGATRGEAASHGAAAAHDHALAPAGAAAVEGRACHDACEQITEDLAAAAAAAVSAPRTAVQLVGNAPAAHQGSQGLQQQQQQQPAHTSKVPSPAVTLLQAFPITLVHTAVDDQQAAAALPEGQVQHSSTSLAGTVGSAKQQKYRSLMGLTMLLPEQQLGRQSDDDHQNVSLQQQQQERLGVNVQPVRRAAAARSAVASSDVQQQQLPLPIYDNIGQLHSAAIVLADAFAAAHPHLQQDEQHQTPHDNTNAQHQAARAPTNTAATAAAAQCSGVPSDSMVDHHNDTAVFDVQFTVSDEVCTPPEHQMTQRLRGCRLHGSCRNRRWRLHKALKASDGNLNSAKQQWQLLQSSAEACQAIEPSSAPPGAAATVGVGPLGQQQQQQEGTDCAACGPSVTDHPAPTTEGNEASNAPAATAMLGDAVQQQQQPGPPSLPASHSARKRLLPASLRPGSSAAAAASVCLQQQQLHVHSSTVSPLKRRKAVLSAMTRAKPAAGDTSVPAQQQQHQHQHQQRSGDAVRSADKPSALTVQDPAVSAGIDAGIRQPPAVGDHIEFFYAVPWDSSKIQMTRWQGVVAEVLPVGSLQISGSSSSGMHDIGGSSCSSTTTSSCSYGGGSNSSKKTAGRAPVAIAVVRLNNVTAETGLNQKAVRHEAEQHMSRRPIVLNHLSSASAKRNGAWGPASRRDLTQKPWQCDA